MIEYMWKLNKPVKIIRFDKLQETTMNWFSGTLIIKYDTGVEELYDNLSYREAVQYVKKQAKQHVIERATYIPANTNISV